MIVNKIYFKILIFTLLPIISKSQQIFTTFKVDRNVGIVNIETLEEIVPPTLYITEKRKISDSIVAIGVANQFFVFDLVNGKKRKLIIQENGYPISTIKGEYYNTISNYKSVLRFNNWKDSVKLDKAYQKFESIGKSNFLIGKSDNIYDILDEKNNFKKKHAEIQASKYLFGLYSNKSKKEILLHVFYGEKIVYLFDDTFKLIKSINKKINDENELIFANFHGFKFLKRIENEPNRFSMVPMTNWELIKYDNEKTFYMNLIEKYVISIQKDWKLIENFGIVSLNNEITNKSFEFELDNKKKIPILPIKYQEEFKWKIED